MHWLWKHWWLGAVALLIVGANIVLGLCWWHNVWGWDELTVYQEMRKECPPVWRDYHFGRVRAGDPVEQVIARTNPVTVVRRGRWTHLSYTPPGFTGLWAVAYDDRMVFAAASSCCWTRQFFDGLTEEQSMELLGKSKDDPRRLGLGIVVR